MAAQFVAGPGDYLAFFSSFDHLAQALIGCGNATVHSGLGAVEAPASEVGARSLGVFRFSYFCLYTLSSIWARLLGCRHALKTFKILDIDQDLPFFRRKLGGLKGNNH